MSTNIDMNMLEQKGKLVLHAVIVPAPAQGHVNALMNLAQLLAISGYFVTFVNTDWIHKRMVEASKDAKSLVSGDDPESEQKGRRIRFLSVPDGLPPGHGRTSNMSELIVARQKLGPALEDLLRTADEKSPSFPPITFIVTDAFMSCTEEVARNMKVPRVIFWPICAAASVSQCYANLLVSEGFIPVNDVGPVRPTDYARNRHHPQLEAAATAVGGAALAGNLPSREDERVLRRVEWKFTTLTCTVPMAEIEDLPPSMQPHVVGAPQTWVRLFRRLAQDVDYYNMAHRP